MSAADGEPSSPAAPSPAPAPMAPLFSAVGRAPPRPQTPPRRAPASLGAAASAALFSHTPTVQPQGAPVAAERGATPPAPAPAPAPPPASPRAAAESPAPVDRDTLLAAAKSSVRPTFSTATLSAAALARLRRPTAPAGLLPEPEPEPEQQPRDSALEPEPEPEPAPRPLGLVAPAEEPRQRSSPAARRKPPKLRSAARAVALSNRGPGSSRPWLPAQPVQDDPDGPPSTGRRRGAGPADVLLQLRPSAGLQTFEDETAPLVDSSGGEGDGHERQPGVEDADGAEGAEGGVDMRRSTQEELEEQGLQARGLAGAIAFAQNLKQAVAPVTLLSTSVEDAELAGDGSFGVEYKCVTKFRYDDRRKKDGEQEAVALHKWDELTSFYATLRERHSQLPDLPELDELTFVSGDAASSMPDDVVLRRQAAGSRMLGVVLAAGSDVSRDPALLELLAVRFEQKRPKRSNSPGRGWGLMMRKNSDRDSAASIPKRVLKQLQEDQKYREEEEQLQKQQEQLGLLPDGNVALAQGAGEADDGGAAVEQERVLDMWGVYKKNEMDDRQFNFCAALSYFIFWVLLMMQAAKAPNAVGLMKHQDAIIDLVLDEEFPDVSFKKNHFDIMTEDELWQWVDGPLTAAFYPDDSSEIPQPLLYSNLLIGSIQLRQVRVRDTECTHLIHDLDPWPGLFGDREDNTAGRCSPRWNADEEDLRPYGGLDGQKYQSTTFASGLKGPKTMAMSTVGDSASEDFGTTGYAVTLPRRRTDFINRTLALREEGAPFVDGRTRMLTFSFNLINGNDMSMPPAKWSPVDVPRQDVTHVLAVQISFVLDSTGHWDKVQRIYAMAPMQEFFFGVDWVFWLWMCFWAWILLLDFNRFWQEGSTLYFKSGRDSGWNRFDIVLYVMLAYTFYVAEVVHVDSQLTNEALMENIDTDVFTDLMPLRKKMRDMVQYIALISFLSVVRFLKYLNGIEQVSFIWRVVGSAKLDLLAFTTVFVLLLLGFALLCSTLFGSVEKNFHNIPTALFSLLRMTVGTLDYDYDVMKHQDSTFAPVFLTLFLFTMMLVCVNFFIAILTESFSKKKSQVQKYKEYKRAEKATGITSQKKTTIFPSFTVQEHPAPWPARQSAGLDNPEAWPRSTLKLHEGGEDDGAQIICLHLFKETQQVLRGGLRRTRSPTGANLRGSRKLSPRDEYEDSYIEEIDGVNGRNENELRKYPWAAYLQLRQEFGSATQILFEMRDGEPLTIKEKGSFGKVIKCKFKQHFSRSTNVDRGGVEEREIDYYANLEVVSIISWESYDVGARGGNKRATTLTPAGSSWTRADDELIQANELVMQAWRRGETDLSTEKPLTSSELAALLDTSAEEVALRARQLDAWGFGIDPPTLLSERISLSKMLIVKLWWRTLRDADRKDCSFSGTVSRVCKRLFVVRSGVEQDVDGFFRALANKLQTKVNMRDVEKAQKVFRSHNIPLGANIRLGQLPCRIQLYLKLAGKRSDGYLAKTYDTTDARSIHMMWLENYINEHYTDQIKLVDKPPPQPQNQDEELPPAQPLQIAQPTPPLSPSRDSSAGGGGRPAAIDVGGASSVPLGAPPSPEKMRTRATTIAAAEPAKAGGPRGWSRLKSADIRKDFGAERRRSPTMKDVVEEASPRSRSQTRDEPQPQPQPEPEPPSEGAPREAEAPGARRPSVAAAPQPALFTQTPSAQPTAAAVPPSPSGSWPPAPGGGAVLSVRDSRAAMLARARTAAQARGAGGQRNMYL